MWSLCLMTRGQIRVARGELEAGLADLDESLAQAHQIRDPQLLWPALALSALARSLVGDAPGAAAALAELEASARDAQTGLFSIGPVGVWAALAAYDLGRPLSLPAPGEVDLGTFPWLHAAESVLRGELETAADTLRRIGARTDEAQVRLRLAERHHAEGRRAEASAELARVLAFYREVGATAMVRRAEELLPVAG
jgi:hypothetical protein